MSSKEQGAAGAWTAIEGSSAGVAARSLNSGVEEPESALGGLAGVVVDDEPEQPIEAAAIQVNDNDHLNAGAIRSFSRSVMV